MLIETSAELPAYLLSSFRLHTSSGPLNLTAGTLVTDPVLAGVILANRGVLLPGYLSLYQEAASRIEQLRLRSAGANEYDFDSIMRGAVDRYTNGTLYLNVNPNFLDLNYKQFMNPFIVERASTVCDAYYMCDTNASADEFDVRTIAVNNVLQSSTTHTYDISLSAGQRIGIPGMVGRRLNVGDSLQVYDSYTPGISPQLTDAFCLVKIFTV